MAKIQDCLKKGPKEIVQWESAFERIMDDGKLQSLVRPSLRVVVAHFIPVPTMPGFRRPGRRCQAARSLRMAQTKTILDWKILLRSTRGPFGQRNSLQWCGTVGRVRRRSQPCSSIVRHGFTSSLTDSEDDFLFLLAVVTTTAPQDAHKRFLREIFRSNGSTFHAEFLVSPPTEVRPLFRERF